ncbi:putative ATP-dependent RNA helicase DDX46 [Acropora cervicornis]|uniref:RNA helicase n=1 Tax=Acropora cervicornis TaxID=6130 RepID=A0AAD9V811_ACRCE|nr:putative ATP-dependent RNA helicase DDX46 [Acropora cervicornis]
MGRDNKRKRRSRSRSTSKDRSRRSRSRERYKERKRSRSKSIEKEKDRGSRRPRERERERKRKRSESNSSHSASSSGSPSPSHKKKDKIESQRRRKSRSQSKEKKRKERPRSKERDKDKDRKKLARSRNRSSSSGSKSRSRSPDKEKNSKSSRDRKRYDDSADRSKDSKKSKEIKKEATSTPVDEKSNENDKDAEDQPINKKSSSRKANTVVGNGKVKEEPPQDDDIDPLDAFMADVSKEVKKISALDQKKLGVGKAGRTTVITHVVTKKKKRDPSKGELMENDQDAMEYSSEDEVEEETIESTYANFKTKKKKDLQAVDHDKVYYSSFRKNFYVEVPELARMTEEEVDEFRSKLENIRVRGKDCPKPVKTWAQTGVSLKLLDVLKKNNYEKPTPIQAQAIPAIMSGRDLIGIAKTGSGKTLAFLLPMYRHVVDQPELERDDGPIGSQSLSFGFLSYNLMTAELFSINHSTDFLLKQEGIAELKRGAEIIVCTPGRMIDMLTANNGRVTNCRRCTYLVLDEADRMFDMGFEPQVMRIIDCIRPDKQTVMFSATFPRQMESLARKILDKPVEVVIDEDDKFLKLLELLGIYQEQGSVLVFVEKQEKADMLFKDLLRRSYPCLSLHGGMDQFDRDSTIADFKNGVTNLMIATSVAARGLDVKQLILVINYDCPNHYEDYVHRCGRTGRAGRKGTSFTFVTSEQGRHAGDVIKALESSAAEVPEELRKLWNDYIEERKAEGKNVVKNSGFTGKGVFLGLLAVI